jgi:hypothetical protein
MRDFSARPAPRTASSRLSAPCVGSSYINKGTCQCGLQHLQQTGTRTMPDAAAVYSGSSNDTLT